MGQSRPLFVYLHYFLDSISIIQIENSIDGVVGIRTQGRRWLAQTKPQSYGGHPRMYVLKWLILKFCHVFSNYILQKNGWLQQVVGLEDKQADHQTTRCQIHPGNQKLFSLQWFQLDCFAKKLFFLPALILVNLIRLLGTLLVCGRRPNTLGIT